MSRFALQPCDKTPWIIGLCALFLLTVTTAGAATVRSQVHGQALIAENPQDPQAYLAYSQWLVDQKQLEPAAKVLENGRSKAHPSAELLTALGSVYQGQGLVARAEAVTRDALAVDEAYVPAHLRLGEIYFELGWPKTGLDCFRKATELAPNDAGPKVQLIGGMLAAGQVAAAEEQCLKFLSTGGEDPRLWLALGKVFEKQERRQQAFTTYGQALTLDPQLAEGYARQGKLFCEFGQYDAAATACQRALQLAPDNALAHAFLGIASSYLGKADDARIHAEIAEKAGMNMVSVWKKIGR